jgi:hypothetical protein
MGLEYKHVRFEYGFLQFGSKQVFEDKLMRALKANAAEGWELKGCYHEGLLNRHAHLIFSRRIQKAQRQA